VNGPIRQLPSASSTGESAHSHPPAASRAVSIAVATRRGTSRRRSPSPLAAALGLTGLVLALICLTAVPSSALAAPPPSFATEGTGPGQLSAEPGAVAIEQSTGDVYVADRNNNRIVKFGPEGEFKLAFGWGVADGAAEPQTCGPESASLSSSCRAGLEGAGGGEFAFPEGIAIDNDQLSSSHGDLYIADVRNHRVEKFSPSGEFQLAFGGKVNVATEADICLAGEACKEGSEGTGPGEFAGLGRSPVAVDGGGTVYVGDSERIEKFSPAGAYESELAFPGVGFVEHLAVDPTGEIYFLGSGQSGIHKYDPTGTELGTRDAAGAPTALAIGADGELLVDDESEGQHLLAYDAAGAQLLSFDGAGAEGGRRGIAYGEELEVVYVLNRGSVRVVPIPPSGPLVVRDATSGIEPNSALLEATLNPEGSNATTYHFEYGTTITYNQSTSGSPTIEPVNEVQTLSLEATSGSYVLRLAGQTTSEIAFDATAAELQADLEALASIGPGNVVVSGAGGGPYEIEFVGALGGSRGPSLEAESVDLKQIVVEGLEERIRPGTASVATSVVGVDSFKDRSVSVPISGLAPATTYHFRLVVENAAHEATFGRDGEFTTLSPVSVETLSAQMVSATAATLEATLDPHGVAAEYRFEYGPTTAYGSKTPTPEGSLAAARGPVTRSALLEGLEPGTTYHYRVVAHSALGTVESEDLQFTTQGTSESLLPDGRQWELVSPTDKQGSTLDAITEEGGLIQASAEGSRITYVSKGPLSPEPPENRPPNWTQILSSRASTGWSTTEISTPHEKVTGLRPGFPSEYKQFSRDLLFGAVEPLGATSLSAATSERTPYLRRPGGDFEPLVNQDNVPTGVAFGGIESEQVSGQFDGGVEYIYGNPDLSKLILGSPQALTTGFQEGYVPTVDANLYEWSAGKLRLISVLPNGKPASEEGVSAGLGWKQREMRNAVSPDGNRIVFETEDNEGRNHLYLRTVDQGETIRIDSAEPGAPGATDLPAPAFVGASSDDAKIFFTDPARLTANSTAVEPGQPDLYMCEVVEAAGHESCRLDDLSVTAVPGEPGNVQGGEAGDASVSESGRYIYFAAAGRLSEVPSSRGEVAKRGQCHGGSPVEVCNLYVYDTSAHRLRLVAVLSGADAASWNGQRRFELANYTARASGRYFTFMSQRSLTGYDNRDAVSGEPDAEVYLYDAETNELHCVSCNPTGARPHGVFDKDQFPGLLVDRPRSWRSNWLAASIPGLTAIDVKEAFYQSRYLDESGRLFFNAADALSPRDSNGTEDVYEYDPSGVGSCTTADPSFSTAAAGCVNLISSGTSSGESAFLDASESGDDVFFLSAARLDPLLDVDGAADVYDAHVCSAAAPCIPPGPASPPMCDGDACQQPAAPPTDATPGSLTFNGAGNVKQCPKGKKLKKAKCVKHKQKKHKGRHHRKKAKPAGEGRNRKARQKQSTSLRPHVHVPAPKTKTASESRGGDR
jgi:DNA-binding beta-propeller fold protein YncE